MAPSAALRTNNEGQRSRLALLVTGGVGLAAASPLLGRLLGIGAADAASKSQDLRILQLVLQLEYTQAALYEQVLGEASLNGGSCATSSELISPTSVSIGPWSSKHLCRRHV